MRKFFTCDSAPHWQQMLDGSFEIVKFKWHVEKLDLYHSRG